MHFRHIIDNVFHIEYGRGKFNGRGFGLIGMGNADLVAGRN